MVALCLSLAPAALGRDRPAVRVDQLGYAPAETKIAYLIAPTARPRARFAVVRDGETVLTGRAGRNRGRWNRRFRAVQPIDISALRAPGRYRIRVAGVTSPPFRVADGQFAPRVADAVEFFQAQRDGADVIAGSLRRRPAHLTDRAALLYAHPRYDGPDSDVIVGRSLRRIAGPVDAEGGWMDAGDFIKFEHTTAYAAALLFIARRELGAAAPPALEPEARFGLAWLDKAWQDDGSLLLQVGIGSGNARGTFNGDHDVWRLPEVDDTLRGRANRYLRHRPVFRANAPGTPLPPNLAGRTAAAFALAAQLDAATDGARARVELATAADIYAAAKTTGVRASDVATALPHAFYPESSWRDDLELGGAELALAAQALGDPRAATWLTAAMRWARPGEDTLNLYDVSALAHAELVRALRASGSAGEAPLLSDLRAQLRRAARRSHRDPFGAAVTYDDFDAAPHAFGLAATAALYRGLTGKTRYDALGTAQRNWAFGANAWGASLMIGVGSRFPRCPQHVVANLNGTRGRILRGAVVNGPNDRTLFSDGLGEFFDEGRTCPRGHDRYAKYTGRGSRYVDDVRSWQTVEPAIDFTAAAALALSLTP
ncbi:MAG TPA: glycoside hydrolase family 9 protein [Solirubrobacteraceae bacterium]|nr:glycoside hydrolase family 9 protein [Solirubrobacteraceae bacterium]